MTLIVSFLDAELLPHPVRPNPIAAIATSDTQKNFMRISSPV